MIHNRLCDRELVRIADCARGYRVLLNIREFKDRVSGDMESLIGELQSLTGRYGDEEAQAWTSSLPKVASIFSSPGFDPLHLYFGSRGNVSLEYQLPASSSWCDVVLLGNTRVHRRPQFSS